MFIFWPKVTDVKIEFQKEFNLADGLINYDNFSLKIVIEYLKGTIFCGNYFLPFAVLRFFAGT